MGLWNKLFGSKTKAPKFRETMERGIATYQIYESDDVEAAKKWLLSQSVDKPNYHVFVITPEGNWGVDVKGLYLEHLLPFQTEITSAECVGKYKAITYAFGFEMHGRGITDNFTADVACGNCETEWKDGVRAEQTTVVRCPNCRKLNTIDLSHLTIDTVSTVTAQSAESGSQNDDYKKDPFITSCFDVDYKELEDNRWFSHFEELPQIDGLRDSGKKQEALSLCLKGLERWPDSFLFYSRAAELYNDIGKPEDAEHILKQGLQKSLSKCSLCGALANRAFKRGDHRGAILWWIRAGVLQLESKIMVDKMPFLNLAYVCQPIGIKDAERWLLQMADRASNEGPVRFNAEGAELRHRVARNAMDAGDDAAQYAIQAFYERYK